MFVREFISTKKEEITSPLLARAVTEFIGLKEMGDRVQASLEMAEQRGAEFHPFLHAYVITKKQMLQSIFLPWF